MNDMLTAFRAVKPQGSWQQGAQRMQATGTCANPCQPSIQRSAPEYSTFSPLAFSLDIILPLVDLGQEKSWGAVIATPQPQVLKELLTLSPGHMVRWLVWFETVFGWIASLLLVGIVSGFAKRTEE